MASSETPAAEKIEQPLPPAPEPEKPAPAPEEPPPETRSLATNAPNTNYFPVIDVVLRFLLFASSLVAVVVMVTSKQTELVAVPGFPFRAPLPAKFNHSPAFM